MLNDAMESALQLHGEEQEAGRAESFFDDPKYKARVSDLENAISAALAEVPKKDREKIADALRGMSDRMGEVAIIGEEKGFMAGFKAGARFTSEFNAWLNS